MSDSVSEFSLWRCRPAIVWVREAGFTRVLDTERGLGWSLIGREAAVWDWLVLGYDVGRLTTFLAALLPAPRPEAERCLQAILAEWRAVGLLEVEGDRGHDEPGCDKLM